MANQTKKELKDQLLLLDTFETNLRILEFELIAKMKKYLDLYHNNLFALEQYLTVIDNITGRWIDNSGSFFITDSAKQDKRNPDLYILISPRKTDKYTDALLSKMIETMDIKVKPKDFVLTIGSAINDVARKKGLSVIAFFPYSIMDDSVEYVDKISSVVRILAVKNIINRAIVFYPELQLGTDKILEQQILPINKQTWKEDLRKSSELDKISEYYPNQRRIFRESYKSSATWYPSIADINTYFIDIIIKCLFAYTNNKNLYYYYQREYQLLISKQDKIAERKAEIQVSLNKIRKEEITSNILILISSFKVKQKDEEETEELIMKLKKGGK